MARLVVVFALGFSMLFLGSQASKAYLNGKPIITPKVSHSLLLASAIKTTPVPKKILSDKSVRQAQSQNLKQVVTITQHNILAEQPSVRLQPRSRMCKICEQARLIVVSIPEQRLYVYEGEQIRWVMLCSTASSGINLPPDENMDGIHNHFGMFSILDKQKNKFSIIYRVAMPYALHYHGGHYIHATQLTEFLGTPASHGCVRLKLSDAKKLYDWAEVGDLVNIEP